VASDDRSDASLRLRYTAAQEDERLVAQGGVVLAATTAGAVYFGLSALLEGVGDVAFARDVAWTVFFGLVALLAGTRVYVRWCRGRRRRRSVPADTATTRVVTRDERRPR
jgi:hypothetical protein